VALTYKIVATKRIELVPGNEVLNMDLDISYAEFLSVTKHLEKPYRTRFEPPQGEAFERNVGFAKGADASSNARITMRNYPGEIPIGTWVTFLGQEQGTT
jgi:hypothetical protein